MRFGWMILPSWHKIVLSTISRAMAASGQPTAKAIRPVTGATVVGAPGSTEVSADV